MDINMSSSFSLLKLEWWTSLQLNLCTHLWLFSKDKFLEVELLFCLLSNCHPEWMLKFTLLPTISTISLHLHQMWDVFTHIYYFPSLIAIRWYLIVIYIYIFFLILKQNCKEYKWLLVNCQSNAQWPPLMCIFYKQRHSYSSTVKIRKWMLILKPNSTLGSCPNNVLYSKKIHFRFKGCI